MREYPVPFSAREETPFMAGLTVREMLWIGVGFVVGLVAASTAFALSRASATNMIICLPAIIPCVLLSFYLVKKKVIEDDRKETLERHYIKSFKYKQRAKVYLNFRQKGG